jgi:hypothetical protein
MLLQERAEYETKKRTQDGEANKISEALEQATRENEVRKKTQKKHEACKMSEAPLQKSRTDEADTHAEASTLAKEEGKLTPRETAKHLQFGSCGEVAIHEKRLRAKQLEMTAAAALKELRAAENSARHRRSALQSARTASVGAMSGTTGARPARLPPRTATLARHSPSSSNLYAPGGRASSDVPSSYGRNSDGAWPSSPKVRLVHRKLTFSLGINIFVDKELITVLSLKAGSICESKLKAGDIIRRINGTPCRSGIDLRRACTASSTPGSELVLEYSRPTLDSINFLTFIRALTSDGQGCFREKGPVAPLDSRSPPRSAHAAQPQYAASSTIISLRLDLYLVSHAGTAGSDQRSEFCQTLLNDLATATRVEATRFRVASISGDSLKIKAIIEILAHSDGLEPSNVAAELERQVTSTDSLLRSGVLTRSTLGVDVETQNAKDQLDVIASFGFNLRNWGLDTPNKDGNYEMVNFLGCQVRVSIGLLLE